MSAFEHLQSLRDRGEIVVLDAAMGTELEARGARMDDAAWCGLANLSEPELVRGIHEDHIRAGADVVITNTYMSGLGPMQRAGAGDRFAAGIATAVRAAGEAVQAAAQRPVAIAGSVGMTPWGQPPGDDAAALRDGYARQVELLAEGGVDVIALEMVIDPRLGGPALDAALATGLPVWLGLSARIAPPTTDREWLPDIDEARAIARACLTPALDAVTVMHSDIHDVAAALEMLGPLWSGALGAYPHHGRWTPPHWELVDLEPEQLVDLAQEWVALGASMLGGCCGLRTRHVAALRAAVDDGVLRRT